MLNDCFSDFCVFDLARMTENLLSELQMGHTLCSDMDSVQGLSSLNLRQKEMTDYSSRKGLDFTS